jgi:ADP-ribose pyrophosphatase YjhB (NUDIX family)
MPGALLVYLGRGLDISNELVPAGFRSDSVKSWVVFLFASYLLGHFAFLIGAKLDDWLYDPLRKLTYWGQVGRLADGKKLRARIWRSFATSNWLFGKNADASVIKAQRIKARALQSLSAGGAINAYQWCKARLSKDHPEGLVAVNRFEADSKFFRSFSVVLFVLELIYAYQQRPIRALVCFGFLLLALLRYVDQRFKATQQAYWFVVTLEGMKDSPTTSPSPGNKQDEPTHAGGVVFRKCGENIEYLFVEDSKDRKKLALPKGHIEPGENLRETAVREVKEKTGYWGRVIQWIEDVRYDSYADSSMVRFYLMEATEDKNRLKERMKRLLAKLGIGRSADKDDKRMENRQPKWLKLDETKEKDLFKETGNLLVTAETKLREIQKSGKGGAYGKEA